MLENAFGAVLPLCCKAGRNTAEGSGWCIRQLKSCTTRGPGSVGSARAHKCPNVAKLTAEKYAALRSFWVQQVCRQARLRVQDAPQDSRWLQHLCALELSNSSDNIQPRGRMIPTSGFNRVAGLNQPNRDAVTRCASTVSGSPFPPVLSSKPASAACFPRSNSSSIEEVAVQLESSAPDPRAGSRREAGATVRIRRPPAQNQDSKFKARHIKGRNVNLSKCSVELWNQTKQHVSSVPPPPSTQVSLPTGLSTPSRMSAVSPLNNAKTRHICSRKPYQHAAQTPPAGKRGPDLHYAVFRRNCGASQHHGGAAARRREPRRHIMTSPEPAKTSKKGRRQRFSQCPVDVAYLPRTTEARVPAPRTSTPSNDLPRIG
ncbi:hypothetical protein C8R47DRAFT_1072624 [Mycena vitilis]|nr:hypothetical protein C8R47DRAFT_1072624 [Mycena vitilis]